MIAVLGAGPHGRQLARLLEGPTGEVTLYDDLLSGFLPCRTGALSHPWVVGAAWPKVRRSLAETLGDEVLPSWCKGTILFPGAQVGEGATLGAHTHVQFNAVVSHGCTVGDFVTIAPGVVLSGEVTVEDGVFLGASSVVIHGGITIGRGALIGAGAVVIRDVPAGAVMAGNPARRLR